MSVIDGNGYLWQGNLTFTYTITDASGNTSEGNVSIPAPNAAPVAVDDVATVVAGDSTVIDVLANDSDADGDTMTITAASAANGNVVINADMTLTYTAPISFTGTDVVTYTISDGVGNSASANLSITVDPPLVLSIDSTSSAGDFSIEARDGEILLTVLKPVEYAGAYTIVTADLQSGPVNLVPPRISGSFAAGQTLTGSPGLWAGDEAHGALNFEYQWIAGADDIPGATSDSYTVQSADISSGLTFAVRASNTAATQTESVQIASPQWRPSNEAAVVGWYDFSDNSSLTLDGSNLIQEAEDKSGAGYTASQPTPSARAALATINGLQAADFSAGAGLKIANGWQPAAQNSIILAIIGNTAGNGRIINCVDATNKTNFAIRWSTNGNSALYIHDPAAGGKWRKGPASGAAIVGGYRSGTATRTGFNGTYSAKFTAGTAATLTGWNIGSHDGDGSNAFEAPIGEIVVVLGADANTTTRRKIEGYLAHKWGLADALDAAHPYKSAAPTA